MKKFALVTLAIVAFLYYISANESQSIVYVDDDFDESTPGWNVTCFNNIQSAINAVKEYGNVIVYDGVYDGFVVNKTLKIMGQGNVIINGKGGDAIKIEAENVSLYNITVINASTGILIFKNASIYNCIARENFNGIVINGNESYIYKCTFENSSNYNVQIFGNRNILSKSNVLNASYGIGLFGNKNKIYGCLLQYHNAAIYLNSSFNNLIEKCFLYNNGYGFLFFNSSNNVVRYCDIKENEKGIQMLTFDLPSEFNEIYFNNFIDNIEQARDECINIWYNQSQQKGNYWSDFDSPEEKAYDNDSNGIIDSPYEIPVDNYDLYPLAMPIDLYPPYTSLEISGITGMNGWYISNITVFLNATDDTAYINYSINGTWYTLNANNVSFELGNGIYEIKYYAVDTAGNKEETKSMEIKVDTIPPRLSYIIEPSEPNGKNGWYISNVEISLVATDENGIDELNYKVDEGGWEDYTGFFFISADGIHNVYFKAIDKAGNEQIENITLKIDKTPPSVEIKKPFNEYVKGIYTIEWNASDTIDENLTNISIYYSPDNGTTWQEIVTQTNNTGSYVWYSYGYSDSKEALLKIEAEDDAGNIGNNISRFILDNFPPIVAIEEPSEEKFYGKDEYGNILIEIIWEAYDTVDDDLNGDIDIEYFDGEYWHFLAKNYSNTGRYTFNAKDWEDGKYKIRVTAKDDAGNVGMAITGNFTIDKKAPFIYVSKPLKGYIYINLFGREILPPIPLVALPYDVVIIGKITIEISASDTHSGIQRVEIKAGEDSYVDYSPPYEFEWNPSLGTHSLEVIAYDNAGNSASYELDKILCINL